MKNSFLALIATSISLGLQTVLAQTPPVAAPNLISNGGFERFATRDNLWDGVGSDGSLTGNRFSIQALAESGTFREMAMPISVAAGDLNADGLVDIVTADPMGYIQVYFNNGTKTEPKYGIGEFVPLFLSVAERNLRRIPKINLFDWSRRGVLDLVVGNYTGELFFIPNTGSPIAPQFRQPGDIGRAVVPTVKEGPLWANLFSPAAYDFNRDGRVDVVVGEGSYSANAVHLLLNQGSNNAPKFDKENRHYLAYGDGREHLHPVVVDFNGDSQMDILASNREGKVGVYLNPGPNWKPGQEFKYSKDLLFGAAPSLGGLVTIGAADFNGDNLFDILVGRPNGKISLATNVGTAAEPKFNAPVDLKGEDRWGRTVRNPNGWLADIGYERGNAYATVSSVSVEDNPAYIAQEGTHSLRIGYVPSPNRFIKFTSISTGGTNARPSLWSGNLAFESFRMVNNAFIIRKSLPQLKIGGTYTLLAKSRGAGASNVIYTLGWRASKVYAPEQRVQGDRGTVSVNRFEAVETGEVTGSINTGGTWTTINKTFTVPKLKDKNLQEETKVSAVVDVRGILTPGTGEIFFDDFQLIEKQQ